MQAQRLLDGRSASKDYPARYSARPPLPRSRFGLPCKTMARRFFSCVAAEPLPTVPHVDLGRYAGTWHEIARLPNWFQRSCERSQARYTPCGDGSLKVENTCLKAKGRSSSIEGIATPPRLRRRQPRQPLG